MRLCSGSVPHCGSVTLWSQCLSSTLRAGEPGAELRGLSRARQEKASYCTMREGWFKPVLVAYAVLGFPIMAAL